MRWYKYDIVDHFLQEISNIPPVKWEVDYNVTLIPPRIYSKPFTLLFRDKILTFIKKL